MSRSTEPSKAFDFSEAAAVRGLTSSTEKLVCLQFANDQGCLYCHNSLLSLTSAVLRNVLEDTQQEQLGEYVCIPLAEEKDTSVWKLALGLIYRMPDSNVTLSNAQSLLLLAHKYDMGCITGEHKAVVEHSWCGCLTLNAIRHRHCVAPFDLI